MFLQQTVQIGTVAQPTPSPPPSAVGYWDPFMDSIEAESKADYTAPANAEI